MRETACVRKRYFVTVRGSVFMYGELSILILRGDCECFWQKVCVHNVETSYFTQLKYVT